MKGGYLLAGWGGLLATDSVISGVKDYEHEFTGLLTAFSEIRGGDSADTFNVYESGASFQTKLDGGKGNDIYNVFGGNPTGSTPYMDIKIDDLDGRVDGSNNPLGNAWDDDRINIEGASGNDSIEVTNSNVTFHLLGAAHQNVDYVAPHAGTSILRLGIFGNAGNDLIKIHSTAATVPVKVLAGLGDDTVVIGGNLDNVLEHLLPDPAVNLGPVVLVGGGGYDTVIIDDSAAPGGRTGRLDAFMEARPGGAVEVGKVSDLGMTLTADNAAPGYIQGTNPGEIRFESFEAVQVKLGAYADDQQHDHWHDAGIGRRRHRHDQGGRHQHDEP